eukprot:Rhum_TRINITY_DN15106_c15_g1::Rhum_TRINITY_DN15106_c15_g1_i1::g.139833::m.139833
MCLGRTRLDDEHQLVARRRRRRLRFVVRPVRGAVVVCGAARLRQQVGHRLEHRCQRHVLPVASLHQSAHNLLRGLLHEHGVATPASSFACPACARRSRGDQPQDVAQRCLPQLTRHETHTPHLVRIRRRIRVVVLDQDEATDTGHDAGVRKQADVVRRRSRNSSRVTVQRLSAHLHLLHKHGRRDHVRGVRVDAERRLQLRRRPRLQRRVLVLPHARRLVCGEGVCPQRHKRREAAALHAPLVVQAPQPRRAPRPPPPPDRVGRVQEEVERRDAGGLLLLVELRDDAEPQLLERVRLLHGDADATHRPAGGHRRRRPLLRPPPLRPTRLDLSGTTEALDGAAQAPRVAERVRLHGDDGHVVQRVLLRGARRLLPLRLRLEAAAHDGEVARGGRREELRNGVPPHVGEEVRGGGGAPAAGAAEVVRRGLLGGRRRHVVVVELDPRRARTLGAHVADVVPAVDAADVHHHAVQVVEVLPSAAPRRSRRRCRAAERLVRLLTGDERSLRRAPRTGARGGSGGVCGRRPLNVGRQVDLIVEREAVVHLALRVGVRVVLKALQVQHQHGGELPEPAPARRRVQLLAAVGELDLVLVVAVHDLLLDVRVQRLPQTAHPRHVEADVEEVLAAPRVVLDVQAPRVAHELAHEQLLDEVAVRVWVQLRQPLRQAVRQHAQQLLDVLLAAHLVLVPPEAGCQSQRAHRPARLVPWVRGPPSVLLRRLAARSPLLLADPDRLHVVEQTLQRTRDAPPALPRLATVALRAALGLAAGGRRLVVVVAAAAAVLVRPAVEPAT